MRRWTRALLLGLAIVIAAAADVRAEVVVAIRYLQAKGVSHAHLYLYSDAGKLLRQLTKDDSGQDLDPIFSPDGKTIVFKREKPGDVVETWIINRDGSGARQLEAPPDWYAGTKASRYFTNFEPEPAKEDAPTDIESRSPTTATCRSRAAR